MTAHSFHHLCLLSDPKTEAVLWCSTSGWGISNFPCYYSLNIVSAHTGICVCAVYVTATECLLESLTGRLLFEVLRLSQRLQRKRHLGDTEKTSSLRINISIHNPDYYNKKGLNGFRTRRSKINRLNMKWLAPPLTSLLTLNAWHTENHGYRSYVTICTGCIKSALYFVIKWNWHCYKCETDGLSTTQSPMTCLSPAVKCLLSGSCLRGTGRWSVLVCYWLRLALCAESAVLRLAVCKGTEVSGGAFWCAPVLTGPLQNSEGQTWVEIYMVFQHTGHKPCKLICVSSGRNCCMMGYIQCFVFVLCQDLVVGF